MNIAVIGTGYVGLVSGTCFAETGNMVTCVDIDEQKVKKLTSGKVTIYEPGLEKIFERNEKEGRLRFTTSLAEGIKDASIIFLALPTPPDDDGSADLKYVLSVSKEIGLLLAEYDYKVIVDKSTVPVGTSEKVHEAIMQSLQKRKIVNGALLFDVVSNPEFLREGVAVEDFMKPNRVIIGTSSERARKLLGQLYAPFVRQGNPIIYMDARSAELTKYAANAFLATKISFMNEVAQVCERVGADVDLVRKGMGSDDRIGRRFLFSGIGYGGSCFPKDVKALTKSAHGAKYDFKILEAVMVVNENQKVHLIPKSISAYDPEAMVNAKNEIGEKISYANNQYEALQNADALVIATEWSEFRTPDFNRMKSLLKRPVIFDGRNLFELYQMEEMGFYYESIGRRVVGKK